MIEHEIDKTTAAAHEALYLRLERLTRQVETIAARKPEATVPAETRVLAETLLREAQRFLSKASIERRSIIISHDLAGLATELGQALARLDLFETRHSAWSGEHNCFVWRLRHEEIAPVARLRPKAVGLAKSAEEKRQDQHIRSELTRLIHAKVSDAYEAGYADCQNGILANPPKPYTDTRKA
jgi:hypothetical protein